MEPTGGDAVLYMRGVLDMSQPEQAIENLAKKAGDITFGGEGKGRSEAAYQRTVRAQERVAENFDTPTSLGSSLRQRAFAQYNRQSFSEWNAIEDRTIASAARNNAFWTAGLSTGNPAPFDDAGSGRISDNGSGNAFEASPNVSMRASRRELRAAAQKRERILGWANRFGQQDYDRAEGTRIGGVGGDIHDAITSAMSSSRREGIEFSRRAMSSGGPGSPTFRSLRAEVADDRAIEQSHSEFMGNLNDAVSMESRESAPAEATANRAYVAANPGPSGLATRVGQRYSSVMRGGTNPFNRQLSYFGRFVAVEGIRTATALGDAFRSQNVNQAMAMGDLDAQAETGIQFRNDIASGMPLGIGRLARLLRDPTGSEEISVRAPLLSAKINESLMGPRMETALRAQSLARDAATTGLRGTERSLGGVESSRASAIANLLSAEAVKGSQEADASRNRLGLLRSEYQATTDDNGNVIYARPGYKAAVDSEQKSYDDIRAKASVRTTAETNNINLIAANQARDVKIEAGLTMTGAIRSGTLDFAQSARLLQPDANNFNSIFFQQRQRQQQRQFGSEQYVNQQDTEINEAYAKDPFTAPFKQLAAYGARAYRRAAMTAEQSADDLATANQVLSMQVSYNTAAAVARSRTDRNPELAIQAAYLGATHQAELAPPEARAGMLDVAKANSELAESELQDHKQALGGSLALRTTVSGIRAKAFGMNRDQLSRRADIASIAGGAELEAQSILRDRNLVTDQQRLSFADSARQEGVNNLQAYRNNYLEGFSSNETDRNNIAPGNKDSARPEVVLRDINDGIKSLKSNVGNGDITGAKGSIGNDSVPNLLQSILTEIQNGGLSRVQ